MKHIFLAELRKVEAKKLVTNDVEVTITFNTSDTDILDLGKIPADTLLRVYVQDARDPVLHLSGKRPRITQNSSGAGVAYEGDGGEGNDGNDH